MQHPAFSAHRLMAAAAMVRAPLAIFMALLALQFLGCSQQPPVSPRGGSDVSNEEVVIALAGKVLKTSGKDTTAVAGIQATIADQNGNLILSQSTDDSGFYELTVNQTYYAIQKLDTNQLMKTIRFYQNDTLVAEKDFSDWIGKVEPVVIVTRDVNSKFTRPINGDQDTIKVFIQFISSANDTTVYWQQAWYNRADTSTSTLVQFRHPRQNGSFAIYIAVFDSQGRLIGRSDRVSDITPNAGDITIPSFDPHNAFPRVDAGGDTAVISGDAIILNAGVYDAFGGRIERWHWQCLENEAFNDSSETTPLRIEAPLTTTGTVLRFVLSAKDNDGNTASDTMTATIRPPHPTVRILAPDTIFSCRDTLKLQADAGQFNESIVQWAWDIGGSGLFTSTPTPAYSGPLPPTPRDNVPCIVRATDKWSFVTFDTILVDVVALPTLTLTSAFDQLSATNIGYVDAKATAFADSIVSWELLLPENLEPLEMTRTGALERRYSFRVKYTTSDTVFCHVRITDVKGKTVIQPVFGRYLFVYGIAHSIDERGLLNIAPENNVRQKTVAMGSTIDRVDVYIGSIKSAGADSITLTIQDENHQTLLITAQYVGQNTGRLIFQNLQVPVLPGKTIYIGLHDTGKVIFGWWYGASRDDYGHALFQERELTQSDLDCLIFFLQ